MEASSAPPAVPQAPPAPAAAGAALPAGPAAAHPAPPHPRLLDYAILALLILIWGTTWAAIRIGLRGIPPFTGVALRFAIAGVVLLALCRAKGVRLRLEPEELGSGATAPGFPWRVWLANGVLVLFIPFAILYWAEQWVPSGLVSVLWATSALWVTLLAHLVLPGERLNAARLAGVFIGFGGVALIFSRDLLAAGGAPQPHRVGDWAVVLLAPLSSAVGVVLVKRLGAGVHSLSVVTVPLLLSAAALACLAWAAERGRPVHLGLAPVAALLYLALVGSALAFSLYFWLLGRLPATTMSLINFMTPSTALLIGALALGEPLTWRIVGGSALVVVGVAVALRMGAAPLRGKPGAPFESVPAAMRRR